MPIVGSEVEERICNIIQDLLDSNVIDLDLVAYMIGKIHSKCDANSDVAQTLCETARNGSIDLTTFANSLSIMFNSFRDISLTNGSLVIKANKRFTDTIGLHSVVSIGTFVCDLINSIQMEENDLDLCDYYSKLIVLIVLAPHDYIIIDSTIFPGL